MSKPITDRARPYAGIGSAKRPLEIRSVELTEARAREYAANLRERAIRVQVVERTVSALKASATIWVVVAESAS